MKLWFWVPFAILVTLFFILFFDRTHFFSLRFIISKRALELSLVYMTFLLFRTHINWNDKRRYYSNNGMNKTSKQFTSSEFIVDRIHLKIITFWFRFLFRGLWHDTIYSIRAGFHFYRLNITMKFIKKKWRKFPSLTQFTFYDKGNPGLCSMFNVIV